MTVAELIKKTRTESGMTQETYGDTFGVTRQTLSSWENGKSMPDLQMLIAICKAYQVSLDSLLNDDSEYVKNVDTTLKFHKFAKRAAVVLCAVVCAFLLVAVLWSIYAKKENQEFAKNAEKLGFVLEDGVYKMDMEEAVYYLPNQKLPFLKFRFDADSVRAVCGADASAFQIIVTGGDGTYSFCIDYGISDSINGTISADGSIDYETLSEKDKAFLEENRTDVEAVLRTLTGYYDGLYQEDV